MFLILFRNILRLLQMFPSLRAQGNVMSNNVSATMFPRFPPPLEKSPMLCLCTRLTKRSFARANVAKIVRSGDAQCNTEESP